MDLRVVHPIPLAVHDVVPEFQVLDDLRDAEQGGPGDPGDLVPARQQGYSATDHESALQLDCSADVAGVSFAPGLLDIGSDRVQFAAQFFDVGRGEVYVLPDVGDRHAALLNVDGAVAGCCGDAPQIAHVAQFQWQYTGLADSHSASERHLGAELLAPPQTKHTVRWHLEDCPGSLRLAMGVVDGEAGLGRWPSLPRRCWR